MFFPIGSENYVEFPHACIRGCANNDRHFKLETGRNSPTGSGSLVIDCDDKDVTHHLHETMLRAMKDSKDREIYLPRSRNRSQSLSEAQRHNQNFPPKSLPRAVERNRTISEPPDKPDQVTPEPGLPHIRPKSMRYVPYSTSPNIKSPISPVGSMSTGISSDGTGSSNSINDPYLINGDHDFVNYNNQPDVIPEESSGEISIEFNPKQDNGNNNSVNQTLPRTGPTHQNKYNHQKQASLTEFHMDDYMDMSIGSTNSPSYPGPPLPRRNNDSLSSSRSVSKQSSITSPHSGLPPPSQLTQVAPSSSYGSEGEYHIMRPSHSSPQMSPPDQALYFDMDRLNISNTDQLITSTPLKSTSTTTLVHTDSAEHTSSPSPVTKTPPISIRSPAGDGACSLTPSTVLTPPDGDQVDNVARVGKHRVPSGDGGYVVMSPGVSHNMNIAEEHEHTSLAILEESLGGHWRSSPRHVSPSLLKDRSRTDSKRNSSCYDDSEAHWEAWRYEDPPMGPDDNYALVYYPGSGRNVSSSRPTPHPRLSPSSSSSAMSGTPSSDSNFHDRLHQFSSYIRDDDDDTRVTSRPPAIKKSLTSTTPRHIPSNNSSRSNISPFGKTPPSLLAGSPTVNICSNTL